MLGGIPMEILEVENLTFTYPGQSAPALRKLSFSLQRGEFVTLFGLSGSGKSTLLRHTKVPLTPFGQKTGVILYEGEPIEARDTVARVGFVSQHFESQIATDKVWHELAFGLESLGWRQEQIRARVAETASFFGIQNWFYQKVSELSGGQKQLLSLASAMAVRPELLVLDEPTAQLDPIAAEHFLQILRKINLELGTTILLSEHRLEQAFPLSDRVMALDNGELLFFGTPYECGEPLADHPLFWSLPTPVRVYGTVKKGERCPVTVREGREWLAGQEKCLEVSVKNKPIVSEQIVLQGKDLWFRYEKELPDVVKGLDFTLYKGEIFSIVGGNGTGKSTALSLLGGIRVPYRGKVKCDGKRTLLPQDPKTLFVRKTVGEELEEMLEESSFSLQERKLRIKQAVQEFYLKNLLHRHPYDLSGGEQQRTALAKAMLTQPDILLLDEPTKGMDGYVKRVFANLLFRLKEQGVSILMVSHDIEFCALVSDRCGMFFDGQVICVEEARRFFAENSFYTTAASRMARKIVSGAVVAEDLIHALGARCPAFPHKSELEVLAEKKKCEIPERKKSKRKTKAAGMICTILFCVLWLAQLFHGSLGFLWEGAMFLSLLGAIFSFLGWGKKPSQVAMKENISRKQVLESVLFVVIVFLTVMAGMFLLKDRKYYFISLLIILETLGFFVLGFERRRPKAREMALVAVLCALAVAGRSMFFMIPQIKPMMAVVILSGVAFGGRTGFLVGAASAFVSNMFFGQGAWTPWQMFSFGFIGLLAGTLFYQGWLKIDRVRLSIFGFFAVVLLYGLLMNTSSLLQWQPHPTVGMFWATLIQGVPFDLLHGGGTAVFLWLLSEPVLEKLERVKKKYGIVMG